jgi:acyl dehydratase
VRAGSRVRLHAKLLAVEPRADGFVLLRTENTVEIEDEDKPALVAVSLALLSAS